MQKTGLRLRAINSAISGLILTGICEVRASRQTNSLQRISRKILLPARIINT